jgi:8-oxo-dGTP pyrophosphatase MutT (NUDIX family)
VTTPRHDFPVESSKDVYTGRVMALRADEVVMPGGRVATREIIEHPGAVAVLALDADDRLMMVHQYRHAVRRRLWELPAGLLDVKGEDPVEGAKRELAEEAGLAAEEWSVLVDIVPSPGFSDRDRAPAGRRRRGGRPHHPLGVAVGGRADGARRHDRQRRDGRRGARGARARRFARCRPAVRRTLAGPAHAVRRAHELR